MEVNQLNIYENIVVAFQLYYPQIFSIFSKLIKHLQQPYWLLKFRTVCNCK